MTSTASVAHTLKSQLYTALVALFADDDGVLVSFGHPGMQAASYKNCIAIEGWTAEQDPAAVSTQRSRNEIIRQTVVVDCVRPGGPEAELEAELAAATLLNTVEYQYRMTDTTMSGLVHYSAITATTCEGTEPEDIESGRRVTLTATLTAHARITGTT